MVPLDGRQLSRARFDVVIINDHVTVSGFGALGMTVIRASTDEGNVASQGILEKLGFPLIRRGTHGKLETLFYELRPRAGEFPEAVR